MPCVLRWHYTGSISCPHPRPETSTRCREDRPGVGDVVFSHHHIFVAVVTYVDSKLTRIVRPSRKEPRVFLTPRKSLVGIHLSVPIRQHDIKYFDQHSLQNP